MDSNSPFLKVNNLMVPYKGHALQFEKLVEDRDDAIKRGQYDRAATLHTELQAKEITMGLMYLEIQEANALMEARIQAASKPMEVSIL